MKKNFEKQVLNVIYQARNDDFQRMYIEEYGTSKEIENSSKMKEILDNLLENKIKDEKELNEIEEQLEKFITAEIEESIFWNEKYYKLGFTDAFYLIGEIKERFCNKKAVEYNNFLEEILNIYEEKERMNVWIKTDKYKKIEEKMSEIKNHYPNVRKFYDDDTIIELTKDELKALNEIISLSRERSDIEKIGCIKLGIKIGKLL